MHFAGVEIGGTKIQVCVGTGKGNETVFYMTIGSGIGGGIVQRGEIYHGSKPGELEIGHTRIPCPGVKPRDWPILESLCSGWTLDDQIRFQVKAHPKSELAKL